MDDGSSPSPPGREEDLPQAATAAANDEAQPGGPAGGGPLGRSEIARAASEVLRALAHTVRSFILYDAGNERIRGFLEDVRDRFTRFLEAFGPMPLEVRPWEIVIGEEVVYSDPDRERSLAFRLYRDGVRRLVFRPGLEWNELVRLIGILSIRYKGVRTQEDDVVTLLWRAGFTHVEITAIEGVVASAEEGGEATAAGAPRTALQETIFAAPYAFEHPWPTFNERAAVAYRAVPDSLLARITEEDGEGSLPHECALLARELLAGLADPDDPLTVDDAAPTLKEMSAFLAEERQLAAFLGLVQAVGAEGAGDAAARGRLLAACCDEEGMRRLVETCAREGEPAPPELLELVRLLPGDTLPMLVDLFDAAPAQQVPLVVAQLLESRIGGATARVAPRLATLEPAKAVELLRIVTRGDPPGAAEAAAVAIARPEEEVQLAATAVLEGAPYGAKVGRTLVTALASPVAEVRSRALGVLVRQRERRAFPALLERLRRGAAGELAAGEARAIGEALARLDPGQVRPLLREWVRPGGLLGRLAPGQTVLRWAALGALAQLPAGDSEELLAWLAGHGGDELRGEAADALARLRKAPGGAGG